MSLAAEAQPKFHSAGIAPTSTPHLK